jgi:hypothetical protein
LQVSNLAASAGGINNMNSNLINNNNLGSGNLNFTNHQLNPTNNSNNNNSKSNNNNSSSNNINYTNNKTFDDSEIADRVNLKELLEDSDVYDDGIGDSRRKDSNLSTQNGGQKAI